MEMVLGSKVKVKILRIMFRFPDKTFTGRELAGLTKEVSSMAVSKSIRDLTSMNLVGMEHHGNSNLLKLNKSSYLFEPLKSLFLAEEATIIRLKEKIKKHLNLPCIKTAAIFGSVAKGNEEINSDIDLLIISSKKQEPNIEKFEKKLNHKIQLFIHSKTELEKIKKKNKELFNNWINGIVIYGYFEVFK